MNYLFLDTSYNSISIYVIQNNNVLISNQKIVQKDMANSILPLLRELLNSCNLSINNIDKLFVTVGPGSFTGVRIGVTVAKVISSCLGIPVIPISTLEFLASITSNYKKIIPIIDARRGNVYYAVYDNNLNLLVKEQLTPLQLIDKNDAIIVSYDGFAGSKIMDIDILKLINKHQLDKPINPHQLVPNYLKKTEAEEKLNDKKN